MIILTIRTDNPQAEIGVYEGSKQLNYKTWEAHRLLAETLHKTIEETLAGSGKSLEDIEGIVCFQGPGSFTGLRIGLSVANMLAYSLQVPIVGMKHEDQWLEQGIRLLSTGQNDKTVMPEYGAPVHITSPRK